MFWGKVKMAKELGWLFRISLDIILTNINEWSRSWNFPKRWCLIHYNHPRCIRRCTSRCLLSIARWCCCNHSGRIWSNNHPPLFSSFRSICTEKRGNSRCTRFLRSFPGSNHSGTEFTSSSRPIRTQPRICTFPAHKPHCHSTRKRCPLPRMSGCTSLDTFSPCNAALSIPRCTTPVRRIGFRSQQTLHPWNRGLNS